LGYENVNDQHTHVKLVWKVHPMNYTFPQFI